MLCSTQGRDNKVMLCYWSRIHFKFFKKVISMSWCIQVRCLLNIQTFCPWGSYLSFGSVQMPFVRSYDLINKYVGSAFYSGVVLFNCANNISPQLKKTRSRDPDLGEHGKREMRKMSKTESWKGLWSMSLCFQQRSCWAYSRPRSGWEETALTD